jgi:hypothetical protein
MNAGPILTEDPNPLHAHAAAAAGHIPGLFPINKRYKVEELSSECSDISKRLEYQIKASIPEIASDLLVVMQSTWLSQSENELSRGSRG